MSDSITREIYPDIFDPGLPDDEFNKTNLASRRLYTAVRHLLSEYFGIDRDGRTAALAKEFPLFFCPLDASGDPVLQTHEDCAKTPPADEKLRFAAVYGQLVRSGHDDPSFGRMERWDRMLVEQGAGRTREEIEGEYKNLFPRGSVRFESRAKGWTPESSRPPASKDETFGQEPNPAYLKELDPELRKTIPQTIDLRVLITPDFIAQFTAAVQKFNANLELYRQVFLGLRREGVGKRLNGSGSTTRISTEQLAGVTERLISDGVSAADPHISLQVVSAIARALPGGSRGAGGGNGGDGHFSSFGIDLPDLDAGTHVEIIPDNLGAVRVIYYAAQLEELRLPAAVETVVEHATSGMLPISRGVAADRVYQWIKQTPRRINEFERRGLYARVLGLAQGAVDEPLPNREFSDLWLRFLSTVSQKYREIDSTERQLVSEEQVHKAGRDLAVNLSLHGYGIAHPAAIELQDLVREMMELLSEPAILAAYGVRDVWQLVDRVSALYLGGSVNGVKYRTMAASGEKVIAWLTRKAPVLSSASAIGLRLYTRGSRGNKIPTDEFRSLAELCERWLAVTGTPDATAERNTDPVDLPSQDTVPMLGQNITFPQSVQDALGQVGANVPALPAMPQA